MSTSPNSCGQSFPPAIIDAVKASVEKTYAAFCGDKPLLTALAEDSHHGPCIAGIISFFGDVPWSLTWVLTHKTAPALAQKFAGFEIPFESSDMGDMAGELVNVLAGEIIAQLDQRRIKSQMSLPTVARGSNLELMPERGPNVAELDYTSKQGGFWLRLAAAKMGNVPGRVPGK
ncbi:MAG: chemotaxis protein CheX [Planctomycetes bacterium]|nr:chemotaxis protein CheX [Planctomycetota bacterium]